MLPTSVIDRLAQTETGRISNDMTDVARCCERPISCQTCHGLLHMDDRSEQNNLIHPKCHLADLCTIWSKLSPAESLIYF